MQFKNFFYSVQAAALSVLLFAVPAFAADTMLPIPFDGENVVNHHEPSAWFVSVVIFLLLIVLLYSLNTIRNALAASGDWSLSDALSEECEVTKDGEKITKMGASSSRLVAFMGMIAILVLFIGFGIFALYQFAMTGTPGKSIDKVVNFLVAGLTLFAPYAVNKFSSLFENIAQPKK